MADPTCHLNGPLGPQSQVHRLDKPDILIGKSPRCTIQVGDPAVSREHCRLEQTPSGHRLLDLSSTNGTFVNGKPVRSVLLRPGDRIRLGNSEFVYEWQEDQAETEDLPAEVTRAVPLQAPFPVSTASREERFVFDFLRQAGHFIQQAGEFSDPATVMREGAALLEGILHPQMLWVVSCSGPEAPRRVVFPEPPGEKQQGWSETIVRRALSQRMAILSSNTVGDSRFNAAASVIMMGIRSAICVPLATPRELYGFIYAANSGIEHHFADQDLEMVRTVANTISLALEGLAHRQHLQQERRLRARLERYHSPAVVSRILQQPEGATQELMTHRETDATVLFLDIVGFTSRVEQTEPLAVARFLNPFFEAMTDIVFAHNGTLDKYIGDAIMAVFGVPFPDPLHPFRAIRAALDMKARLADLNRLPLTAPPLSMRIAIHTGRLIAGDFGSPRRFDYTVLGHTVNTAARIEGYVAQADQIVISDSTLSACQGRVITSPLPPALLPGLSHPLQTYEVLGLPAPEESS